MLFTSDSTINIVQLAATVTTASRVTGGYINYTNNTASDAATGVVPFIVDTNGVTPVSLITAVPSPGVSRYIVSMIILNRDTVTHTYQLTLPITPNPAVPIYQVTLGPGDSATWGSNFGWTFTRANISSDPMRNDFRLSLSPTIAASTADLTGGIIYFLPAGVQGLSTTGVSTISLYSNSTAGSGVWVPYTGTSASLTLTGATANTVHDIYAFWNGTSIALERVAWLNTTTRDIVPTVLDNVLVRPGDATKRYVGSFYVTAAAQTSDTVLWRALWNYNNQVAKPLRFAEGVNSWTQTALNTWRQMGANTAAQIRILNGLLRNPITVQANAAAGNSTGEVTVSLGISQNSTTAVSAECLGGYMSSTFRTNVYASLNTTPPIGDVIYRPMERAGAAATWYGDDGTTDGTQRSGIHALWSC